MVINMMMSSCELLYYRAYACNDSSCSSLPLLNVSRDNLLNDVFVQMRGCSEVMCWKRHLSVTFKGEAGLSMISFSVQTP